MTATNIDILLIEDDARLAELTARISRRTGCESIEARGDRALERFAQERPRLVLLDLLLPGKDGRPSAVNCGASEVPIRFSRRGTPISITSSGSKPAPTIT
jgi:DNA-binding response OmpR family regulator